MIGLFNNVPKVFKVANTVRKVRIDNFALLCQYRFTTLILVVFTVVICAQNYIGQPMDCIQSSGSIPNNVLNTYCYFIGTYSMVTSNTTAYPFYGIAPEGGSEITKTHLWYQWVPFYLTFLAILFYSPHFFWKHLEGGTLKSIVAGMEYLKYSLTDTKFDNIPSLKERDDKVNFLGRVMYQRIHANLNKNWTRSLIFIEIYALFQAIFSYCLTDIFLGGSGAFYRLTIQSAPEVFPTMAKCAFYKYGPSGTIQKHDALCVLAVNIVNEKFFFILHIWFPFVIALAGIALIWRLISFFAYRNLRFNKLYYRETKNSNLSDDDRQTVLQTISYWDWVFLTYVADNASGFVFNELYHSIANEIENDVGTDSDCELHEAASLISMNDPKKAL